MKKTANADIQNLFRKFGGDTGSYQEIQQDYVMEKAQQNWPIVNAIEKAHAAAPKLRASPPANRTSPPPADQAVPRAGLPAGEHSLSALFAQTAQSARPAPDHSLFGSLAKKAEPVSADATPAPAPLRSLFSGLNKGVQPTSRQPVQAPRSENDQLNTVFSRLLAPQEPVSSPDKNLRSLFGFLNK